MQCFRCRQFGHSADECFFVLGPRRMIGKPRARSAFVVGKPSSLDPRHLVGRARQARFVLGVAPGQDVAAPAASAPAGGAESGVYVLELSDGRFYVGKSRNVATRLAQHATGGDDSALCARLATRRVLPLTQGSASDLESWERAETLERMYTHGIDRVRGWMFTTPVLGRELWDVAYREICERFDLCRRCGLKGHFIKDCRADGQIGKFRWFPGR